MEVILLKAPAPISILGILHVCGGDPIHDRYFQLQKYVFSTYVEVILFIALTAFSIARILHVCGGDPTRKAFSTMRAQYSPRMWR